MSDWQTVRLDKVAQRVAVKNTLGIDEVLTVSAEHGLVRQEDFFTKRVASADLSTYYVVQPGDLVYNKSRAKGAPWGVVVRHEGNVPAVVTPLYIVFRPRPGAVDPDYLLLACSGDAFFESLSGTLREGSRAHGLLNVRLAEFFAASLPLPPPEQQRRIADLVHSFDHHVRALKAEAVAANVHFRELVRDLTTPGPDAVPLTDVSDNLDNRRIPVNATERATRPGAVPYYGAAGRAGWIDESIFDEPLVLLGEDGAGLLHWDTRPIAYRIDGPAWVNNHAHVLRATGVSTDWLAFSLMHYDISDLVNEGTRPKLNKGVLSSLRINVPTSDSDERLLRVASDTASRLSAEAEAALLSRDALASELLSGYAQIEKSYDRLFIGSVA